MGILTLYMQFIERGRIFTGKLGKCSISSFFYEYINIRFFNLVDKTGLDPVSRCTLSSKLKKYIVY